MYISTLDLWQSSGERIFSLTNDTDNIYMKLEFYKKPTPGDLCA